MSDTAMTILDGNNLRSLHVSLPESDDSVSFTGAQVLHLAESKASESIFGLSLPQTVKSSALKRINVDDDVTFRQAELTREAAAEKLNAYLTAIADELKDNPLVVSILDGNTLRLYLEDEDDFAMLAESLFTELDTDDKGKISKSEVRNALVQMGVEMGIPPFEEFPSLNDILKKHGADATEELGQSQFAELLQAVLQDVAESLSVNNVVIIRNIKVVNGSKITKVLADEELLNNAVGRILGENCGRKNDQSILEIIRVFLEENGKELGLPPSQANEAVNLLYDAVFHDVAAGKYATEEEHECGELLKEILVKFAEQLEANPVYCDLDI
uniref:Uncharacterized protein MANES_09G153500 n=1 Tax=Rhizophora mucronata TaxID=61149 RepID=A0A2P2NH29_RHIMU